MPALHLALIINLNGRAIRPIRFQFLSVIDLRLTALRYYDAIKTAYAAEQECGLTMGLVDSVTESLRSVELINSKDISYLAKQN